MSSTFTLMKESNLKKSLVLRNISLNNNIVKIIVVRDCNQFEEIKLVLNIKTVIIELLKKVIQLLCHAKDTIFLNNTLEIICDINMDGKIK